MVSQHMCVLAVLQYILYVYWSWSPTAHVCAGSFYSMCVYWSWSPTAHVCAGSFPLQVYTAYGFVSMY